MRNLKDVIDNIINVSENIELNLRLKSIRSSVDFTAPEVMHIRWNQVHETMLEHTLTKDNKPEFEWQYKVLSIFSTRSVEEIKSELNKE